MTRPPRPAADPQGSRQPGQGTGAPGPRSRWRAFYEVIARIPPGRVATYGQVARLAGFPGQARQVGYALAAMPAHLDLPWHRVINARGEVSRRSRPGLEGFQRHLLEAEGVTFGGRSVDLTRYRWRPDT